MMYPHEFETREKAFELYAEASYQSQSSKDLVVLTIMQSATSLSLLTLFFPLLAPPLSLRTTIRSSSPIIEKPSRSNVLMESIVACWGWG